MSTLTELSPNAEVVSKQYALKVNTAAAIGLQNVLKSNLGPTGTLKLLVGGAGQLKLTKDGVTLLKEMQIQHPTAALIARTASAQDEVTGDGTTSTVLLTGELLKQAEIFINDGLHPRIITDGYDIARDACIEFLNTFKITKQTETTTETPEATGAIDDDDVDTDTSTPVRKNPFVTDRELLLSVARTSLQTKLDSVLVEQIGGAVVDAIQTIYNPKGGPIDLNRVEILTLTRRSALDSRFVRGLVLDHGGRHPDMPNVLKNVHIMIANVSLEYEQTETQAGFVYTTAEEREKLVESERKWLDERCKKIIDFKRSVCKNDSTNETFCIINQKGVDPLSLDIFAKEGILCLRRAKRRNMERLALATGGQPILSLEDLDVSHLGYAGKVSEESYGEDKFTFIEDCPHAQSCTLLLQGPNQLTTEQVKDAVKDGLRAIKNTIEDESIVPGGGSFELAASMYLMNTIVPKTKGKLKLGVQAYAEALLIIPKTLISNSGYDVADVLLQLKDERNASKTIITKPATTLADGTTDKEEEIIETYLAVGVNCRTGTPMLPELEGIYDNVRVKRQSLYLSTVLANQLLLVDEVMRAGKNMGRSQPPPGADDM